MTWGAYWMFYECPQCKTKFKSETGLILEDNFGKCPKCKTEGVLVGESKNAPHGFQDYEDNAG
jgi:transcription initiation factor IIE alpha subunit